MYKRIEKGIRESKAGTYSIDIELPPRTERNEHSHSFHIGTVNSLDKAREIKRKADDICSLIGKENAIKPLQELKKSISKRGKLETQIRALERILDTHDRIYGKFTLENKTDDYVEYTEEEIQEWKDEREALTIAIELLKAKRR